jgi:hypothetical protein
MEAKQEQVKPVSKKALYITSGVVVTAGMLIIKGVTTVINKAVVVLLDL